MKTAPKWGACAGFSCCVTSVAGLEDDLCSPTAFEKLRGHKGGRCARKWPSGGDARRPQSCRQERAPGVLERPRADFRRRRPTAPEGPAPEPWGWRERLAAPGSRPPCRRAPGWRAAQPGSACAVALAGHLGWAPAASVCRGFFKHYAVLCCTALHYTVFEKTATERRAK